MDAPIPHCAAAASGGHVQAEDCRSAPPHRIRQATAFLVLHGENLENLGAATRVTKRPPRSHSSAGRLRDDPAPARQLGAARSDRVAVTVTKFHQVGCRYPVGGMHAFADGGGAWRRGRCSRATARVQMRRVDRCGGITQVGPGLRRRNSPVHSQRREDRSRTPPTGCEHPTASMDEANPRCDRIDLEQLSRSSDRPWWNSTTGDLPPEHRPPLDKRARLLS